PRWHTSCETDTVIAPLSRSVVPLESGHGGGQHRGRAGEATRSRTTSSGNRDQDWRADRGTRATAATAAGDQGTGGQLAARQIAGAGLSPSADLFSNASGLLD